MMILNTTLLIISSTVLDSTLRILQIVAGIVMAIAGIGLIAVQVNVLPYSLRTLREMRSKDRDISWYNHTTTLYSRGFLCLGVGLFLFSIGIFVGLADGIVSTVIKASLTLIGSILILFAVFFILRSRMLVSKENKQQRKM